MKLKYIYTLSVAAALLATACTDEWDVQEQPVEADKGYTVKVEASMNPASRIAIENDGEAVNYYWTADDSFTVFDTKNSQQTEFTINPDSFVVKSTKTHFIGSPEKEYSNGQKLYAVFNKKEQVQLDANGNVNFDLSHQNGQLNEDFQYMWGDATYKEGKPLEFVFRHLATTLMVKIPVPEGVEKLSNVTLYSRNLVSKATLVLNEAPYDTERQFGVGDLVYSYDENGLPYNYDWGEYEFGSITLDGEFTPVNGYVTVYIYTLAAKQYSASTTWYNSEIQPFILFTDEDGLQHVSTDYLEPKEMEVGGVYSLTIENTLPLVHFANETTANGETYQPYQIANADQMFSLMMRALLRLEDQNLNPYYNRSYQLTDDIVLDTRSVWYPIDLRDCNFDGNGKTVSGEMNVYAGNSKIGLFGLLKWSTLKDLTLDTKMTLDNNIGETYVYVGTLVGILEAYNNMLRCFSFAQMVCGNRVHGSLGGLIGTGGMSTIENCGFSGRIESGGWHDSVGGLIGNNNCWGEGYKTVTNGCYSDGSIIVSSFSNPTSVGGLCGSIGDPNMQISNCWAKTTIKSINDNTFVGGGVVGSYWGDTTNSTSRIKNTYWNDATEACMQDNGLVWNDCASFEGAIPTPEQLEKLNYAIMASGLMFSAENGRLVKTDKTGVPPSDIENW